MIQCPHCQSSQHQNKAGFTQFGSQRYFCCACRRTYTPEPKAPGHPATLRQQAVRHSLEGLSQRKVARLLGVAQQSVGNWLRQADAQLTAQGVPTVPPEIAQQPGAVVELDELFTFVTARQGQKNRRSTS